MSTFLAEAVGTMILIILGCGVNAGNSLKKTYNSHTGWLLITIAWGFSVTIAIYAVGNVSGAHINPAVTVGLAVAGDFPWAKVPGYITAQFIGGFIGAVLVWLHYLPHWKHTEDQGSKLGVFSTSPAIPSFWANFISETLGTFVLILALLFIGANDFTDGLNPIVVGLLIMAIGMSMGGTTGYAINPARDLAPRLAHTLLPIPDKGDSNWSYAIIPGLGPIFGGALGAAFYLAVFKNTFGVWFFLLMAAFLVMAFLAYREQQK